MITTEIALQSLMVLKAYPLQWWSELSDSHELSKVKLRQLMYGLERNGFVSFKQNVSGVKLVFLTSKGYAKVEKSLQGDYIFRNFNEGRKGIGASDTHHYMMFRVLIELLQQKKEIIKITSFNNPSSKITTQILGTEVFIIPDVTIYYPDEMHFIEVDTGLEVSYQIYTKLLKYLSIFINRPTSIDVENFSIYFSLSSLKSLYTLFGVNMDVKPFKGKGGLVFKHFQKYSNTLEVSKNRSINITTSDIIEKLKDDTIKIYAGFMKDSIETYSEINLKTILQEEIQ